MSELSLRVSVATLSKVIFQHPQDASWMLALECKATLIKQAPKQEVRVMAQPFGGAVRFRDPSPLRELIKGFRFDSQRSQTDADFRILIQPTQWPAVRSFCIRHLEHPDDPVLETDPDRELAEEFYNTLGIQLSPGQYITRPIAILVENKPTPTENIRAIGQLTVRIYRIFETQVLDDSLAQAMIGNSARYTDQDLLERALRDVTDGGSGRANAILTLPLRWLTAWYLAMPPEKRGEHVTIDGHSLDDNVPAILEGVPVPKFQRAQTSH